MTEPKRIRWLALLLWVCTSIWAQEGPFVPCVGCESLTRAPYPETGSWYNPEQSGSGINLEIQNGDLLGYYYGYSAEGKPEWHLIVGSLARSEQAGVLWELETDLQRLEGGNCLNCPYQPPGDPEEGPPIRLEFLQRNYMRVTVDNQAGQYFLPLLYGAPGEAAFEEQTPYLLPAEGTDPSFSNSGAWVIIVKPNLDPPDPTRWQARVAYMSGPDRNYQDPGSNDRIYNFAKVNVYEVLGLANIFCEVEEASGQPVCSFAFSGGKNPKEYIMPIGNFGDGRFFGEAADGSTVEGYRLAGYPMWFHE